MYVFVCEHSKHNAIASYRLRAIVSRYGITQLVDVYPYFTPDISSALKAAAWSLRHPCLIFPSLDVTSDKRLNVCCAAALRVVSRFCAALGIDCGMLRASRHLQNVAFWNHWRLPRFATDNHRIIKTDNHPRRGSSARVNGPNETAPRPLV